MSDQSNEPNVQSGGFLKGYRTYISAGVLVIGALAAYAVGDADLSHTLTALVGAVGLVFAAHH
jgi:hypothetical protein